MALFSVQPTQQTGLLTSGANLGQRATSPYNNLSSPTTSLPSSQQAPNVTGYYRQGNDVYDPQGNYVSFSQAQQRGIVPLLSGIPQRQTTQPTTQVSQTSTPSVSGYYRQGNDVYDPQGNYVSFAQAQQKGIVPLLAGIPQGQAGNTNQLALAGGGQDTSGQNLSLNQNNQSTGPQPYQVNNQLYGGLIAALANQSQGPNPAYQAALPAYNSAVQQLSDFNQNLAKQYGNIESNPIPLEFQQGREQVLARQAASQEAALQGAVQQQQTALGLGLQQQGLSQQALAEAAGLAAPQAFGPTQVPFNPATGQYGSPAAGAYGGGGIASVGGLNTQINQGAAVQQMTGTLSQAQALASNLSSLIDSADPNIFNSGNSSVLANFGNKVSQWIDKQTGDPNYQNFANLINEISSRYASILNQAGGTPTDQSTISHAIINGLAGGQDIKTVLGKLEQNATDSINALKKASGTNAASGSTSSSNLFGFW